jgi:hypothetical protein
MSKPVEMLEKHFQWGILGLGGLFLAWTAYQYVVIQPTATIGGRELGAGEIDPHTVAEKVGQLEDKMNGSVQVKIDKPTFDAPFKTEMAGPTTQPLALGWSNARPLAMDLPEAPTPGSLPSGPSGPVAGANDGAIKELKDLPPAVFVALAQGLSKVNPNAVNAGGAAGLPQPGAGAPGAVPTNAVDRNWVTGAWEIDVAGIAKSMADANIQPGLMTLFLRVELEREEKLAGGAWGKSVIVRPLSNSLLARNPLPAANAGLAADTGYRSWAEVNQVEILQPGFYMVLGGTPWAPPSKDPANTVVGAFDPSKYATGPIPADLTEDEKKAVIKYRQEEAKKKEEAERERRKQEAGRNRGGPGGGRFGPGGGGPPGGGGGGGGRPGGFFAPEFPNFILAPAEPSGSDAPLTLTQAWRLPDAWQFSRGAGLMSIQQGYPPRPPGYPPSAPWPPPGMFPDGPRGQMPSEMQPGMNPEQPQNPQGPVPVQLGSVPPGPFDPAAWQAGNITTLQHDETIEGGRVYRYRVRYLLLNPLYQQAAAAAPAVASKFSWASAWSDWSAEVSVADKVSFYVTQRITSGTNTVQVEVFRFIDGRMRSKIFQVAPGDLIGSAETSGDFSTGYVLLDVRRDLAAGGSTSYALVLAPDGSIARHDESDAQSSRYRQLKDESRDRPAVGTGN